MITTDDGTYLEIDGRPAVRFERRYPHSVDRVWAAISTPEGLAAWFPSPHVTLDPRVGGTITLRGDEYAPDGTDGLVLAWEPPSRFAFQWGKDELRLTLTSTEDGCVLELLDLLEAEGGAARNSAGWTLCLARLTASIDGGTAVETDFAPLLDHYKASRFPDDGWLPHAPADSSAD